MQKKLNDELGGDFQISHGSSAYVERSVKEWSVKAFVRKLKVNGEEICDQAKINDDIKNFIEEVFKYHKRKSFINLSNILNTTELPCLTNEEKDFCEIELGEK